LDLGLISALSIPFVYYCLPETKGKTLEEIDYIFATGEKKKELENRFLEARMQVEGHDRPEYHKSNGVIQEKVEVQNC